MSLTFRTWPLPRLPDSRERTCRLCVYFLDTAGWFYAPRKPHLVCAVPTVFARLGIGELQRAPRLRHTSKDGRVGEGSPKRNDDNQESRCNRSFWFFALAFHHDTLMTRFLPPRDKQPPGPCRRHFLVAVNSTTPWPASLLRTDIACLVIGNAWIEALCWAQTETDGAFKCRE